MSPQDTRQAIMDTAQGLIQRRGANSVSYQHISDEVGIRKASIHYHFPTKGDLIDALLDRFYGGFRSELKKLDDSGADGAARLAAYVGMFEETFLGGDAVCLYGMLGAELASLGTSSADRIADFYRLNLTWLEALITHGLEDGSLRFAGDPARGAMMIFSLLEGGMLIARADQGPGQYRDLTAEILALFGTHKDNRTRSAS